MQIRSTSGLLWVCGCKYYTAVLLRDAMQVLSDTSWFWQGVKQFFTVPQKEAPVLFTAVESCFYFSQIFVLLLSNGARMFPFSSLWFSHCKFPKLKLGLNIWAYATLKTQRMTMSHHFSSDNLFSLLNHSYYIYCHVTIKNAFIISYALVLWVVFFQSSHSRNQFWHP